MQYDTEELRSAKQLGVLGTDYSHKKRVLINLNIYLDQIRHSALLSVPKDMATISFVKLRRGKQDVDLCFLLVMMLRIS